MKSPAVMAGLFCFGAAKDYSATRSLLSAVPIELNVVTGGATKRGGKSDLIKAGQ